MHVLLCVSEQVAFGASLGPHGHQITLVYKDVLANTGNAYNPATGTVYVLQFVAS